MSAIKHVTYREVPLYTHYKRITQWLIVPKRNILVWSIRSTPFSMKYPAPCCTNYCWYLLFCCLFAFSWFKELIDQSHRISSHFGYIHFKIFSPNTVESNTLILLPRKHFLVLLSYFFKNLIEIVKMQMCKKWKQRTTQVCWESRLAFLLFTFQYLLWIDHLHLILEVKFVYKDSLETWKFPWNSLNNPWKIECKFGWLPSTSTLLLNICLIHIESHTHYFQDLNDSEDDHEVDIGFDAKDSPSMKRKFDISTYNNQLEKEEDNKLIATSADLEEYAIFVNLFVLHHTFTLNRSLVALFHHSASPSFGGRSYSSLYILESPFYRDFEVLAFAFLNMHRAVSIFIFMQNFSPLRILHKIYVYRIF